MLIDDFSKIIKEETKVDTIGTQVEINKNHPLFEGHFSGNPVMPGVLIIQLFKEQAERFTGKKLELAQASNIKFLTVIEPENNAEFFLQSNVAIEGGRVEIMGKIIYEQAISTKLKLIFKTVAP